MRVYGEWAGNPSGHKENMTQCIASVFRHGGYIAAQCSRRRGHGPDGLYCKQHGSQADQGRHVNVGTATTGGGS